MWKWLFKVEKNIKFTRGIPLHVNLIKLNFDVLKPTNKYLK